MADNPLSGWSVDPKAQEEEKQEALQQVVDLGHYTAAYYNSLVAGGIPCEEAVAITCQWLTLMTHGEEEEE